MKALRAGARGAGTARGKVQEVALEVAQEVRQVGRYMAQSFRLMVGQPDYGSYLRHMAATHPQTEPMSFEAFFVERQEARYGGKGGGRCC